MDAEEATDGDNTEAGLAAGVLLSDEEAMQIIAVLADVLDDVPPVRTPSWRRRCRPG